MDVWTKLVSLLMPSDLPLLAPQGDRHTPWGWLMRAARWMAAGGAGIVLFGLVVAAVAAFCVVLVVLTPLLLLLRGASSPKELAP